MMVKHLVGIGAVTMLILVCTFLPFLPGRYDGFAVTLSIMAQVFGLVGLLLVPLGGLWVISEMGERARAKTGQARKDRGYYFAIAALIASSLVATFMCLTVFFDMGRSLGLGLLALWAWCVWRMAPRLRSLKHAESGRINPAPLYLLVVPIVVAIVQYTLIGMASEFGRQRAIDNSAQFIRDIEAYYAANGRYPSSLLAEWNDYRPLVIGIKEFHYEPNGAAYNVFFRQPPSLIRNIGTIEIVMYNKLDEHFLAAHNRDILLWTPEQLHARRGYYALYDAPTAHWKYFWFD